MTLELIAQLKGDEGLRLTPYRDTKGILTIGYGTNLEAGLSVNECEYLLYNRASRAQEAVYRIWPWITKLDDARLGVIINMAFNMGLERLQGFGKMMAAVQDGHWEDAAKEMEASLWFREVGARAVRLCKQMRTGEWQYAKSA